MPVLLNNWEATYMDFNEEKILTIARKAKDAGVELFVLDDGWFGERDDDNRSLGDWFVNRTKLPNGIDGLSATDCQGSILARTAGMTRVASLSSATPTGETSTAARASTNENSKTTIRCGIASSSKVPCSSCTLHA